MAHYGPNSSANANFSIYMTDTQHDTFKELYEARHEPENLRPIAELYWRVVLLCAVCAAGGVIVFGFWQFTSVMSIMNSASTNVTSNQISPIDRTLLEESLNAFALRRANFELQKNTSPAVTDPTK